MLAGCVIPISPTGVSTGDAGEAGAISVGGDSGTDGGAAPTGTWINVTANLANMDSECGNMASVTAKPDEDMLIAGIAQKGLWASRDGGGSWKALGTGKGSAVITNRPQAIVFDPQDSKRFWESGIYNGGGVYETEDDGTTLTQLGTVIDSDLVSVDFSDPNRMTLLAGGHEMAQTLNRSTDGGTMWSSVGGGLPANTNCTFPLVIDAQTHLVGCAGYGGGPIGVYRTIDGGDNWTRVASSGGASAPLRASDGSIYWATPNLGGLARSTDDGQHWTDVVGANVIESVHPVELPDGRLATLGTQYVLVSADHGKTWLQASVSLPYNPVGLTYSSQQKAFYIWHFTCGFNGPVPVPPDAIMSFHFDYTKN
jgi:photosystem II stability/assembly factor-like uncharacterized protein